MNFTRQDMVDKVIKKFGFEAKETIDFAKRAETEPIAKLKIRLNYLMNK